MAGLDLVPEPDDDPNTPILHAAELAGRFLTGLDGVYALLDHEHTLFLGRKSGAVAYSEEDPSDPPVTIGREGPLGQTTRGRRILCWRKHDTPMAAWCFSTGPRLWVVSLARDFSDHVVAQLPGAAEQGPLCTVTAWKLSEATPPTAGFVPVSAVTTPAAGYASSVDHTHKVVWTGDRFSFDEG
ncbi:MAG: hypothetical protein CM1200mP26_16670 [Acidimicrobiales bacterium]|nr:MAG: hypothetical protein CM1200mP26_16670 [Acidimicrobiales bacterium]